MFRVLSMRRLGVLALLFACAPKVSATITFTGRNSGHGNAGGGTTSATTITNQVAGNINVCAVQWADSTTASISTAFDTFTVTDSSGNSYGNPDVRFDESAAARFVAFAIVHASNITASASNVITLTISSQQATVNYGSIECSEWHSSVGTALLADRNGSADPGSITSPISVVAGGPTIIANELVYAAMQMDGGTLAAGSGYTLLNAPFTNAADEYQLVTSIATYTATMTFAGTHLGAGVLVTFKEPYNTGGQVISAPLLPQLTPSVAYPSESSYTITTVASGANFQTALNGASCGTILSLAPGGSWSAGGTAYNLPNTNCACHTDSTKYVIIRPTTYAGGSTRGKRIDPSTEYANLGYFSSADNNGVFRVASAGESCYWFLGIAASGSKLAIMNLGDGTFSPSNYPHDFIVDHSYIDGIPLGNTDHCVILGGNSMSVVDSYIAECHDSGPDAQGIYMSDGAGPFLIQNNFIEASTENTMAGGGGGFQVQPCDFTVTGNDYFKPVAWWIGNPAYDGFHYTVKNLQEWKTGCRILVTGNVFENTWTDGQHEALIFNVGCDTDGAGTPAAQTYDVTEYYNWFRHIPEALSYGGCNPVVGNPLFMNTHRILFHDNLWSDIDKCAWAPTGNCGSGSAFEIGPGSAIGFAAFDLWSIHETFDMNNLSQNNTVNFTGTQGLSLSYGIQVRDSIMGCGLISCFSGNSLGSGGNTVLTNYSPGANYTNNCVYGTLQGTLTNPAFANMQNPANRAAVFVNPGSDFHVAKTSICSGTASDGKDPGANIDAINAATTNAVKSLGNPVTVTNVSPATFTHNGSTSITITGAGFLNESGLGVIIGGAGPTSAISTNSCGFGAPGQFTITAFTDTSHFTYTGGCVVVMASPVTVALNDTINVIVNSAQTSGTINRYTPGNACTSVMVTNSTTITCTTPAASGVVTTGPVSVFVSQWGIPVQSTVFPSYN